MMQVTFTSYDIAERIVTSYELYKKGMKCWSEHMNFCSDIRMLFGEDFYNDACRLAEESFKCA